MRLRDWVAQQKTGRVKRKRDRKSDWDECMVCGKHLRRHHRITGGGRTCSPQCAHLWVSKLS